MVILGKTGRNFAAGMSGGIAYCYDEAGDFKKKCNMEMVEFQKLAEEDLETIKNLLASHMHYTESPVAKNILDNFNEQAKKFVKIMPLEYKRILEEQKVTKKLELSEVSDG